MDFLRQLGAWRLDRNTNEEGLTLAGLLMFGKLDRILEVRPYYLLDYQERETGSSSASWIDRVTIDHTWSGNLYDFFRKVYPKLVADLKIPFQLAPASGARRIDETPVHVALREALVNTLIHADFSSSVGILIHKRPDLFGFRNPGGMRVPLDVALYGGNSDCRNRSLQKMFQLIGKAEQSGQGIPKILHGWEQFHKRTPLLRERQQAVHDLTILTLPLESLLPQEAMDALQGMFVLFAPTWTATERIAMVVAYNEGAVTNQRLHECCPNEHPRNLTSVLGGLVNSGCLIQEGSGRWTSYYIKGRRPSEGTIFGNTVESDSSPTASSHIARNDVVMKDANALMRDANALMKNASADYPEGILELAKRIRLTQRALPATIDQAIIALCSIRAHTREELAELLGRTPGNLSTRYLSRLIRSRQIRYTIPNTPRHPQQAYATEKEEPGN